MRKIVISIFLAITSATAFAQDKECSAYQEFKTNKGKLVEYVCPPAKNENSYKSIWSLNGTKLVSGEYPMTAMTRNDEYSLFVLSGPNNSTAGCSDEMYLVDLTGPTPKVFSFGVNHACAEFHWAKWSKKKRSVIALKFNVQFTYSDGKLIAPLMTDEKYGTPFARQIPKPGEVVAPFVKELPLPQ